MNELLLDTLVTVLHAAAAKDGLDGGLSDSQFDMSSLVAGALVRLARKRGVRGVPDLTNAFLLHAYTNEFARAVRTWSSSGAWSDAVSPNAFYTTALWLRQALIARGVARPVDPWPQAFLPTITDSYPAHAVLGDGGKWLYGSLEWRRLFEVGRLDLAEGDFDLSRSACSRGVEVLELPMRCVDDDGVEYGTLFIAGHGLVAPLALEQFNVSLSAWMSLLPAVASA